ncbi:hypothetical protein GCM10023224_07280 [Streptomonospora halophila]|uniref:Uncharacterized protein n=1 Tax=Streptomonospora halophila TaxID=427369 RepID=A0ABP9G6W9_9ACTN
MVTGPRPGSRAWNCTDGGLLSRSQLKRVRKNRAGTHGVDVGTDVKYGDLQRCALDTGGGALIGRLSGSDEQGEWRDEDDNASDCEQRVRPCSALPTRRDLLVEVTDPCAAEIVNGRVCSGVRSSGRVHAIRPGKFRGFLGTVLSGMLLAAEAVFNEAADPENRDR